MNKDEMNISAARGVAQSIRKNIRSYTMIIALLVIWGILGIMTEGTFFMPRNMSMLVRQTSVTGILSLGMLLVIVTGNIDLSAGSAMGLLGGIAAVCQVWYNMPVATTILVVMIAGVVLGIWQGIWIAYLRVPAFIVTLGGYLAFRGILLGIGKSVTIAPMSNAFKNIGQGYLPLSIGWALVAAACLFTIFAVFRDRSAKRKYGFTVPSIALSVLKCLGIIAVIVTFVAVLSDYQGIPIPVVILLGLGAIVAFVTTKTRFGRSIYAIGCNREAADLAGINTKRIVFIVYILEGIFCGLAGIILTARLNAGAAGAGNMAEMDAIAACVIGGASLSGGLGTIPGAIIGALVMCSLDNGMSLMNTENFWQYIVKGLILVIAVFVDIVTKKKAGK